MRRYAVNSVGTCSQKFSKLRSTPGLVTLYQKANAIEFPVFRCQATNFHMKRHCRIGPDNNHVSIDRPVVFAPSECLRVGRALEKGETNIRISGQVFGRDWQIPVTSLHEWNYWRDNEGKVKLNPQSECEADEKGRISYINNFRVLISEMNLTNSEMEDAIIIDGKPRDCTYDDGGCEATNIDPVSYGWDSSEQCLVYRMQILVLKTIKWEHRYFILADRAPAYDNLDIYTSEYTSNITQPLGLKFEIFPEKLHVCNHPESMYQTQYHNLL